MDAFAKLDESVKTAIFSQGLFEDDIELALEQDSTILVCCCFTNMQS
jgi:hypothetical protein